MCMMMCADIVPGLEGEPVSGGSLRSTFLSKREC
jgi:hypothetical protein